MGNDTGRSKPTERHHPNALEVMMNPNRLPLRSLTAVAALTLSALTGCGDDGWDECEGCGRCTSEDVAGTFEVEALHPVDGTYPCEGIGQVILLFTPAGESHEYNARASGDGEGVYDEDCLVAAGITPGALIDGTLNMVKTGNCGSSGQNTIHDAIAHCWSSCD